MSILDDFGHAIDRRVPLAGSTVLDVGCGDGAFVRLLAQAGAHVTGIECGEAQLALCRQATPVADETYLSGVGQALPFADDSFDATVFRASLHHVPAAEMLAALREARRVTRPGGEIFVFEPLPTGTMFELVKLVDDETEVRRLAQAAIALAVEQGWLTRRDEASLLAEVVYQDLEAVRRNIVNIDASRAAAFEARRDEVLRVFESGGTPTDRGRLFRQPFRLDVLA